MIKRKKSAAPRSTGNKPTIKPSVADLRRELDRVDAEIVAAINRRAELAQQIGALKQDAEQQIYDPQRERAVLEQAETNNPGPLNNEAVRAVFRELIGGTRAVQMP
ncbi:MAG: chorismate mutase, partial [Pirellulales bacterium]